MMKAEIVLGKVRLAEIERTQAYLREQYAANARLREDVTSLHGNIEAPKKIWDGSTSMFTTVKKNKEQGRVRVVHVRVTEVFGLLVEV